jgi:hypothetical protein
MSPWSTSGTVRSTLSSSSLGVIMRRGSKSEHKNYFVS